MDYVVLETESRGKKLRAVVHLFEFFSAFISERAWKDRWHGGDTVPHSPLGLVLGSLESGVSTVLEEAGCLRDFVKTPGNDSAALGLAVLELRGKPVSPLSHGMGPLHPSKPWKLTAILEIRRQHAKWTWAFIHAPVGQMVGQWAEDTFRSTYWGTDYVSHAVPKKWEVLLRSTKKYPERRHLKETEQSGKTADSSSASGEKKLRIIDVIVISFLENNKSKLL